MKDVHLKIFIIVESVIVNLIMKLRIDFDLVKIKIIHFFNKVK